MGSQRSELDGQSTTGSTPEDVAALYAWANLVGAKYRDYSASRREHRAKVRYEAAKALLDRELKAQAEAMAAAEEAEHEAAEAEARALAAPGEEEQQARFEALREAEAAALKAAKERVEAARRAEAATHATVLALQEERELAEAQASATQQAVMYREAEEMRKRLAGPQPIASLAQEATPPAEEKKSAAVPESDAESVSAEKPSRAEARAATGTWKPLSEAVLGLETGREESRASEDEMTPESDGASEERAVPPESLASRESVEVVEQGRPAWLSLPETLDVSGSPESSAVPATSIERETGRPDENLPAVAHEPSLMESTGETGSDDAIPVAELEVKAEATGLAASDDAANEPEPLVEAPRSERPRFGPVFLAVFSPAAGAGSTSVVANLGRALAAAGECVVLVDTTAGARLPYAFGGRELAAGLARTYWPPEEAGEPLTVLRFEADAAESAEEAHRRMARQIASGAVEAERAIVDLSPSATALLVRLVSCEATVMIPLTPTLDALKQVEACERLLQGTGARGVEAGPVYLLNRFDAASPLHRYMRTRLREVLGDRLLPLTIREAEAIGDAFRDGDTVLDYAPESEVAQEYRELARWVREGLPVPVETSADGRSAP